ncbi:hypothetical protein [Lentibacter algarum]|uniref:hypothetical protein n=1 Tax=Lentibacter algarum TaxID=576131 RepID=UPI0030F53F74
MITLKHTALSVFALTALSACGSIHESPTRSQATPMAFAASSQYAEIDAQAASLNRMADELVRKSTGKGAVIGASLGCGLGLISASSAQKCVTGAVAGGVVGAVVGHEHGKRKVAARVAQVSKQELSNTLLDAGKQLSEIKQTLPQVLAQQNAELARLKQQKAANALSQEEYDTRFNAIRDARAALAAALSESADKARVSADNLGTAASQGQSGLMWHIGEAKRLEDDSMSTRSQITLL